MHYRTFAGLDWRPSALGFGAMRLPVLTDPVTGNPDFRRIDEPRATAMLRTAIDGGVNYVDTAYVYHEGASEGFVGRALKDGYRDKVKVATKLPFWKAESADDCERLFSEQLERLDLPSVDFYLLHSIEADSWPKVREAGVLEWAERALADGRIGHLGFSFHDEFDLFKEIIAATDLWSFCQIQYNYMDGEYQAGTAGLRHAVEKGLAVIAMEPVRGGQLARPPEAVAPLWAAADEARAAQGLEERSPVDWALHWVWDDPDVSLVLSGMSTMEQVEQNVAAAGVSGAHTLTPDDHATYARVREEYRKLSPVPCTSCRYCMPCPQGVHIPEVFELYNDAIAYGELRTSRLYYGWMEAENRADQCTECGECEPKCPQKIAIIGWLETAQQLLAVAADEPLPGQTPAEAIADATSDDSAAGPGPVPSADAGVDLGAGDP